MKGLTTMYSHKYKKWAFIVAALGATGMAIERLKGFIIFSRLDREQHHAIFEWILLLGLFTAMFCKEKYDDERAKAIRLKSLQAAFSMQAAVTLGIALTSSLHKEFGPIPPAMLFAFGAIGIVTYLLMFHVGLYLDFFWEYEDKGVWENLRSMGKNKWGILAWLIIGLVMLLFVTFLELQ